MTTNPPAVPGNAIPPVPADAAEHMKAAAGEFRAAMTQEKPAEPLSPLQQAERRMDAAREAYMQASKNNTVALDSSAMREFDEASVALGRERAAQAKLNKPKAAAETSEEGTSERIKAEEAFKAAQENAAKPGPIAHRAAELQATQAEREAQNLVRNNPEALDVSRKNMTLAEQHYETALQRGDAAQVVKATEEYRNAAAVAKKLGVDTESLTPTAAKLTAEHTPYTRVMSQLDKSAADVVSKRAAFEKIAQNSTATSEAIAEAHNAFDAAETHFNEVRGAALKVRSAVAARTADAITNPLAKATKTYEETLAHGNAAEVSKATSQYREAYAAAEKAGTAPKTGATAAKLGAENTPYNRAMSALDNAAAEVAAKKAAFETAAHSDKASAATIAKAHSAYDAAETEFEAARGAALKARHDVALRTQGTPVSELSPAEKAARLDEARKAKEVRKAGSVEQPLAKLAAQEAAIKGGAAGAPNTATLGNAATAATNPTATVGNAASTTTNPAGKLAKLAQLAARPGVATTLRVVGYAGPVLSAIAVKDRLDNDDGHGAAAATGGGVGGVGGAAAGALAGTALIPVPIFGTLVGAAIGGGALGYIGDKIGGALVGPEADQARQVQMAALLAPSQSNQIPERPAAQADANGAAQEYVYGTKQIKAVADRFDGYAEANKKFHDLRKIYESEQDGKWLDSGKNITQNGGVTLDQFLEQRAQGKHIPNFMLSDIGQQMLKAFDASQVAAKKFSTAAGVIPAVAEAAPMLIADVDGCHTTGAPVVAVRNHLFTILDQAYRQTKPAAVEASAGVAAPAAGQTTPTAGGSSAPSGTTPAPSTATPTPSTPAPTPSSAAPTPSGTTPTPLTTAPTPSGTAPAPLADVTSITVKDGDNLTKIAQNARLKQAYEQAANALGGGADKLTISLTLAMALAEKNGLAKPDLIQAGLVLAVPTATEIAATAGKLKLTSVMADGHITAEEFKTQMKGHTLGDILTPVTPAGARSSQQGQRP